MDVFSLSPKFQFLKFSFEVEFGYWLRKRIFGSILHLNNRKKDWSNELLRGRTTNEPLVATCYEVVVQLS